MQWRTGEGTAVEGDDGGDVLGTDRQDCDTCGSNERVHLGEQGKEGMCKLGAVFSKRDFGKGGGTHDELVVLPAKKGRTVGNEAGAFIYRQAL